MAVPPTTEEAFLREVDEELRRDTLQTFWTKWGRWLIGLVVGGLALFGAWLWWSDRNQAASGVEGETLSKAVESLESGNVDGASKSFETLKKSEVEGNRALATLAVADIATQKGDTKKAIEGYATLAKDESLDAPWRDLGLIRQTTLEFDTLKPDVVIERMKPLAVKGNPWFGSAGELVAMAHLKAGKPELAAALFAEMAKDEQVPETIRTRAREMAGSLGVDAVIIKDKAEQK